MDEIARVQPGRWTMNVEFPFTVCDQMIWDELVSAQTHPAITELLERYGIGSDFARYCGLNADGIVVPVVESGELVDLLTFDPCRPNHWTLRLGVAVMLGGDSLVGTTFPVRVHRTPLSWLQFDSGDGVCVLDWRLARRLLGCMDDIVAEDIEHGEVILRYLSVPLALPRISIPIRDAAE